MFLEYDKFNQKFLLLQKEQIRKDFQYRDTRSIEQSHLYF